MEFNFYKSLSSSGSGDFPCLFSKCCLYVLGSGICDCNREIETFFRLKFCGILVKTFLKSNFKRILKTFLSFIQLNVFRKIKFKILVWKNVFIYVFI